MDEGGTTEKSDSVDSIWEHDGTAPTPPLFGNAGAGVAGEMGIKVSR